MSACGQRIQVQTTKGVTIGGIYYGEKVEGTDYYSTMLISQKSDDNKWDTHCTGTLIRPNLIVTAAHCLEHLRNTNSAEIKKKLKVSFGNIESNLTEAPKIRSIKIHPHYKINNGFDLGLIYLEELIPSEVARPIPLATKNDENNDYLTPFSELIAVGFGEDERGESGVKKWVPLKVFSKKFYEFMAVGDDKKDTCQGDSGGPLYKVKNEKLTLVGIVSRSSDNAVENCGEEGIYVRSSIVRSWLNELNSIILQKEKLIQKHAFSEFSNGEAIQVISESEQKELAKIQLNASIELKKDDLKDSDIDRIKNDLGNAPDIAADHRTDYLRAIIYYKRERFSLAHRILNQALEKAQTHPDYVYLKANIYDHDGDIEKAYLEFKKSAGLGKCEGYLHSARIQIQRGKLTDAQSHLDLHKKRCHDLEREFYSSQVAFKNGDNSIALTLIDRYLSLSKLSIKGLKLKLEILKKLKRAQEAEVIEKLIFQLGAREHFHKAHKLWKEQNKIEAIEEITRAIEIDPTLEKAYHMRSSWYKEDGQNEKAYADLLTLEILRPDDLAIKMDIAHHLVMNDKDKDALNKLDEVIALKPIDNEPFLQKLSILKNAGNYSKALGVINELIKRDPNNDTFYSTRSEIYGSLKQYENSLSDIKKAIEIRPDKSEHYTQLAFVYVDLSNYDEVIKAYTKSIKIFEAPFSYFGRAAIYENYFQDYEKAIADLTKALELNLDTLFYNARARVYEKMGEFELAKADKEASETLDDRIQTGFLNVFENMDDEFSE